MVHLHGNAPTPSHTLPGGASRGAPVVAQGTNMYVKPSLQGMSVSTAVAVCCRVDLHSGEVDCLYVELGP